MVPSRFSDGASSAIVAPVDAQANASLGEKQTTTAQTRRECELARSAGKHRARSIALLWMATWACAKTHAGFGAFSCVIQNQLLIQRLLIRGLEIDRDRPHVALRVLSFLPQRSHIHQTSCQHQL